MKLPPTRLTLKLGMLGTEHREATASLHMQVSFLSKVPDAPAKTEA